MPSTETVAFSIFLRVLLACFSTILIIICFDECICPSFFLQYPPIRTGLSSEPLSTRRRRRTPPEAPTTSSNLNAKVEQPSSSVRSGWSTARSGLPSTLIETSRQVYRARSTLKHYLLYAMLVNLASAGASQAIAQLFFGACLGLIIFVTINIFDRIIRPRFFSNLPSRNRNSSIIHFLHI